MIAVLQWVALGACLFCAAWRVPATLRGRNTGLFWAFVLLSVAVGLSLPEIYLVVDAGLGGRNIANLAIRFALYAIFYILAVKFAAAYRSASSARLIRGPVGISLLALISVATLVLFLLSDLPSTSVGLQSYSNQPSVQAYGLLGRLYPAYAAACLIRPTALAAVSAGAAGRKTAATAAGLICSAFIMVLLLTAMQIAAAAVPLVSQLIALLSYTAIVCMALGLSFTWISLRMEQRRKSQGARAGGQLHGWHDAT
ncbi:hypothetical protein IV500_08330 [Paeniglutamicibacter antarcticus]|uniref:Uncharacterized protein n=1 Tax=Arthrobacter terrae TaxID=2935737 RepID=A0A931CMV8_9MICC|nr:hypothetical protein [Arthrobacter terrae]MBG0739395.1 hypothetical protein [Arthrobacter terrae]